jgi:hypothetical protein
MFREWGGPGTRQEPSVWPEFPKLPHLRLLPGIKIRKNLMFQTDGFDWISEERRHLTLKVSPLLRQKLFWEQDAHHMHWKNSSASSLHNSHHPHAAIEYKHWNSVPRFSSCNSLNTLRDQIRVFTLSTPNKVWRLNPNILPWCWVGYCGKTIPGGRRFLYKKSRHALLFMSFVCVGSSTPVILQISNFKIISSLTYTNNFLVFSTQQTKAVT